MSEDFYEILGVDRTASTQDIQQAYRKLARQHHPDVNSDPRAEDRFKAISEASEVLTDPATRARYDRFGPDFRKVSGGMADDAERVRTGAGRARSGPGGASPFGAGASGGRVHFGADTDDVDFGSLFGGFGRGGGGFHVPGADQLAEIELGVEEAFAGGRRTISLAGPGGRDYEVTIPPGSTDGQRIRLAGQGGRGQGDAPAGDLYLVVRLRPHPRYRVQGRDIHLDLALTPWEAALGATVAVDTPSGEVKVKVTPGSSTGRRFRLRGQGMPHPRGTPGDLYAEVKIRVPPHLTDRERELFAQLADASSFDARPPR